MSDVRVGLGTQITAHLERVMIPVFELVEAPTRAVRWFQKNAVTRGSLMRMVQELRLENMILRSRTAQLSALQVRNQQLQALLGSKSRDELTKMTVADILALTSDPFMQLAVLNKGSRDGVYVGQPALDEFGVVGQVVDVGVKRSRLLMISSPEHALPVMILRNGIRTIAEGTGDPHFLTLRHVTTTTDVQLGDQVVTSGLGIRYPYGYPVGIVSSIRQLPGEDFQRIKVAVNARLDTSSQVLLLWSDRTGDDQKVML